ncbi:ABC transporter ATP-binding protein [Thermorudis peleae]|uniref:ABC transporter ATP-binding protein n=1 Tax=Thermorudis peleae TaxID=1382356 RepID=UPI00068BD410|nr:ATP-binding cassette domain-containing protein [Thermorudis peleae]
MAIIELRSVRYCYPGSSTPALTIPNWTVDEGEFVVIAGRSGAGKSTLLRTLNGLIPHFTGGTFGGSVYVAGRDTKTIRPAQLSHLVGFLAQDPETQVVVDRVAEELQFALESLGFSPQAARLRTEEALDILGISALHGRRIHTLSGGERQRVALAVALATRPTILALDEPTSQLDPWAAESLLSVLTQLTSDLGLTLVLTEHRLERVLGNCTRLVIMADGQIVHDGEPRSIAPLLPYPPPLIQLGMALDWRPLPLTVREARQHVRAKPMTLSKRVIRQAPREPGIRVERLSVQFASGSWGLRACTLHCPHGAVTAILGRNGAGKTTLLRAIRGLIRPREGRIWLGDRDITKVPVEERTRWMGYVPQLPSTLFLTERVEEELCTSLDTNAASRAARLQDLLHAFQLTAVAAKHPYDLSVGEQQRLALAIAVAHDPPVLLLDEPTRGLDPEFKHVLAQHLRALAEEGKTVILTSHDCELIALCADWVVLLAEGEVIAEGEPSVVFDGTLAYSTQINRVFGQGLLTVRDVLASLAADAAVNA